MQVTREQLQQWLDEPEGRNLEFKEAKQSYQFDKLVEYCVALANEGGGTIILGVTDKRPRRIVGTAAFAEPGRTEAGLHERLSHRIPIEEVRTYAARWGAFQNLTVHYLLAGLRLPDAIPTTPPPAPARRQRK